MKPDPTRLDEPGWLQHRIDRLRTVARLTTDPRAVEALEELIDEARCRLDEITARRRS